MSTERSFRLGYSTIIRGPTPDLDEVLGRHRCPELNPLSRRQSRLGGRKARCESLLSVSTNRLGIINATDRHSTGWKKEP